MAEYKKITPAKLLGMILTNEFVTDDRREYIAMSYYTERVNHFLM